MRDLMQIVETECKTPGAMYHTHITDDEVEVSVKLPPEVKVPDMTDKQGDRYDDLIHNAMEEIVAKLIGELDAEADEHWDEARKNDQM
jgi:hypothetical protein